MFFIPVNGWTATPTKIAINHGDGRGQIQTDSFDVIECPLYDQEKINEEKKHKKSKRRLVKGFLDDSLKK